MVVDEQGNGTASVFFSYSHRDEKLRDDLATHLEGLRSQGVIHTWYDREITAGSDWENQIHDRLESADVILLLISRHFVASKYCRDVEMSRAIQRHDGNEARVIPVILRPTDWHNLPCAKLQALPKDGRPITKWGNRDEAFLDVVRGIRGALDELRDFPATRGDTSSVLQTTRSSIVASQHSERPTLEAADSESCEIELTINRDFDSFSEEDQRRLLDAIATLLKISDVKVVRKREGSIKLTLRLTPAQADNLLWAIRLGKLDSLDVVDCELLDKDAEVLLKGMDDTVVSSTSSNPYPQLEDHRQLLLVLAETQLEKGLRRKLDPEDLVQEVMLRAYKYFPDFEFQDESEMVKAWLLDIMGIVHKDLLRYFAADKRDLGKEEPVAIDFQGSALRLETLLVDEQTSSRIPAMVDFADALKKMSELGRDLIIMRLRGMTTSEIADATNRSEFWVENELNRQIKVLRRLLY